MNWGDILPGFVAIRQRGYERRRQMVRARALGMTYKEIGRRFGVTKSRAREQCNQAGYDTVAPIEKYFSSGGEIAALIRKLQART